MAKGCSLYPPFFPSPSFYISLSIFLSSLLPCASPPLLLLLPLVLSISLSLFHLRVPHLVCFARDFSWNPVFFVVASQSSLLRRPFSIPACGRFNFFFSSPCVVLLYFYLSLVLLCFSVVFTLIPLSFRLPSLYTFPSFGFITPETFVIFICLVEI